MNRSGFTLVEVMVVVVIISMLASMGIVQYMRYLDESRIEKTRVMIASTTDQLNLFKMSQKTYPAALSELVPGRLKELPKDGWDRVLIYARSPEGFRLGSLGEDGVSGGEGVDADLWN